MKRILLSLMTIAVVAAVGIGAARAYFSDTETSVGNTINAGTIDISVDSQNPWTQIYTTNWADVKPGMTRDMSFVVKNEGENDLVLWKRVAITTRGEGILTEPECGAYGGTWTGTACTGGTVKNDLDSQIHYGMTAEATTVIDPAWNVMMKDMDGIWVSLGKVVPGATLTIAQTYKLDENAGNEYQGDTLTWDIELYAEQLMGTGPVHAASTAGGALVLDNKSLAPDWAPVVDGIWGLLTWDASGNYTFKGHGLNNAMTFDLVYWNGSSETVISGTGTPVAGELTLTGTYAGLNTNTSAKYWLRPTPWSAASDANTLYEANLVN